MDKKKPSISPIYKSLDELFTHNQSIFHFLKDIGKPGLLKAVWDARDSEISTLKTRLEKAEKFISTARQKYHDIFKENLTLQRLFNDQVSLRQKTTERNQQLKKYVSDLELLQEMKEEEIKKLQETVSNLTEKLEMSHQALLKLDFSFSELNADHEKLKEEHYQTERNYKETKSKYNHFRRLNQQMEQELLKQLDSGPFN